MYIFNGYTGIINTFCGLKLRACIRDYLKGFNGILNVLDDAGLLRRLSVTEESSKNRILRFRRQTIEHVTQVVGSISKQHALNNLLKVLLSFLGQIAFLVEAALILGVGDELRMVPTVVQPLQYAHAVLHNHPHQRHVLFLRSGEQQTDKGIELIAHLIQHTAGINPLRAATLGVRSSLLAETDGLVVAHVYHAHKHGILHLLDSCSIQTELLGMIHEVLLVLLLALPVLVIAPHLLQADGAVVTLDDFTTTVYHRCACVGGNTSRNFLWIHVLSNGSRRVI